ncbi:hypothetical protein KO500_07895 [Cellulophaga baltica]|uniref:dual OB domain-containing protein n=1 Tax=Cellulophaga TaxID=104264 RepID=UPI001C067A96|nr:MULTISPECIES: hypothetical protein [Cellulophaga]MBU2996352.1 hypothetical protein [Cellulophaga baltica]MDO6767748.1 hypothetical protein [Cellulophaga sp. 1_MG-2023]
MEVLITSKTKYGSKHVCVGGLVLENNSYIRLLNRGGARNPKGWYQFSDTDLNIGDVWDIDFKASPYIQKPHVEDVFIEVNKKIRIVPDLADFINRCGVKIYEGHIENLFEGKLKWQKNDKGYISENEQELPNSSVGFWKSDTDLILEGDRYFYNHKLLGVIPKQKSLKYVGMENPPKIIPKETLIRISLAKWLKVNEDIEERCYLQLSGWY